MINRWVQLAPPSVRNGVNKFNHKSTQLLHHLQCLLVFFHLSCALLSLLLHCRRVATISLRSGIARCLLTQVQQTGNGHYDDVIASCTAWSSTAVVMLRKLGATFGVVDLVMGAMQPFDCVHELQYSFILSCVNC